MKVQRIAVGGLLARESVTGNAEIHGALGKSPGIMGMYRGEGQGKCAVPALQSGTAA